MTDGWPPLLDPGSAEAAARRAGVPSVLARLNVFRLLLGSEKLARAESDLLLCLLAGEALDRRLRELVIMRIAWTTGSSYEWAQHWRVATGLGIEEADLLGVRAWGDYGGFGPIERVTLAATDECTSGGAVSEATMAELRAHFDEPALLELICAIGHWSMVSTLLRSMEVPLEDGVAPWPPDGVAPWPPDGVAPWPPDGVAP